MRFNGKVFLVNVMILWFVGVVQLFPTEFEDSCSWQKVSVKPVPKTKSILYKRPWKASLFLYNEDEIAFEVIFLKEIMKTFI